LRSRRLIPSLHGALELASLLLPLLLALSVGLGADCHCQAPALCRPITHRPSPRLRGDVSIRDIINATFRASWLAQQVKLAKTQYMDGINLDKKLLVTFDVSWSPNCLGRRCYNYTGIADACDFLFVMSYGERSLVWSQCIAGANSPYTKTLTGYDDYIKIGINPKKLVMGIPWYGYDYTCQNLSANHVCTTAKYPCKDAVYCQVAYQMIMKQVNSSTSGRLWDKIQQSPYYHYQDQAGHFHQVWYDDPQSISLKAAYVQNRGLLGIGMWHANCLDYSGDAIDKQQTEEMWKALKPKL
ncbi:hypothetical protein EI555_000951, partial [Monodon monoceros]